MNRYDQLIKYYGVGVQEYGRAWPELKTQLLKIYRDKVAGVPWIPADWLPTVELIAGISTNVPIVVPSTANYDGGVGADFLDTPDKRQWWNELANLSSAAVAQYAAGKSAAGKLELDRLYAASEFWSRAYDWGVILASPVTFVRTVWNNPYASVTTLGIVILGGYLIKRAFSRRGRK